MSIFYSSLLHLAGPIIGSKQSSGSKVSRLVQLFLLLSFCWPVAMLASTTYYLSPSGRDSNNGLSSGAPWLTPNHTLNCGDVILATPSASYNAANFGSGKWGFVSCPSGNNVAWLKCQQFDACKITSNNQPAGIWVDRSFWGVQGWEVTMTSGATWGGCFVAAPNYQNPQEIHHIIFANNVANGCQANGIASTNRSTWASVDYFAVVGNIVYNASQSNTECYSGISINEPIQSDWQAGTHIYVAGNFSYGTFDRNPCAGGRPYDGEGIIFDTLDGSVSGIASPYGAQVLADNNILISNGGRGLEVGHNDAGAPPNATVYIRHNTLWGNNRDENQNTQGCGELSLNRTSNSVATYNLSVTSSPTGCGYFAIYPLAVTQSNGTDQVTHNLAYSPSGTNLESWDNGSFSYGSTNTVGIDPRFANPVVPGAPYCGGTSSAANCMAPVVANFTPGAAAALGFGYQKPGTSAIYDPLYPQWLCNVNLPSGLVNNGC
jgi:hypothetical protein